MFTEVRFPTSPLLERGQREIELRPELRQPERPTTFTLVRVVPVVTVLEEKASDLFYKQLGGDPCLFRVAGGRGSPA